MKNNILIRIQEHKNKLHNLLGYNILYTYLDKRDKEVIEETKEFLEELALEYKEIIKDAYVAGFGFCADYTTTKSDRNFLYKTVDISGGFNNFIQEK